MERVIVKIIDIIEKTEKFDLRFILIIILSLFFVILLHRETRVSFVAFISGLLNIVMKKGDIYIRGAALFLNERVYLMQIDNIDFHDNDKNFIFRTILKEKTITVIEETRKMADNYKEYNRFLKEVVIVKMIEKIYDIEKKYEERIMTRLAEKYGKEKANKIYYCVYDNIDNKQGFKQYHQTNIEYIIRTLDGLSKTPIENIKFIMFSFFNAVNVALSSAISDLYKIFVDFNGDLVKLIHNEVTEDIEKH